MLQGSEIIIILLVALVVLGPERLPEIARKLGRWSVELRQAARDLRSGLEAEVGDLRRIKDEIQTPVREIQRDVRDAGKQIEGPVREIRGDMRDVGKEIEEAGDTRGLRWVGPEPGSGPTAADALSDLEEIEADEADEADPNA